MSTSFDTPKIEIIEIDTSKRAQYNQELKSYQVPPVEFCQPKSIFNQLQLSNEEFNKPLPIPQRKH